jgi:hypothetical protein
MFLLFVITWNWGHWRRWYIHSGLQLSGNHDTAWVVFLLRSPPVALDHFVYISYGIAAAQRCLVSHEVTTYELLQSRVLEEGISLSMSNGFHA